ncbi:UDP-glucuronosyltransferase 2B19 isoform X8 [Agrilus planipennis]|uniref:UDP-glucuronosyltransferase n=1 Tax=Agrilus planipennis TaxID=224129 RepID=A0A1W4XIA4_AGRPL|nr:UDP-glucuronosyltransferase 2B19 isoform X8 [Agrilus planipennis]
MFTSVVTLFCTASSLVSGANILGIFSTTALSEQAMFQMIWKELSRRGHKVTVITPGPLLDYSLVNLTDQGANYSQEDVGFSPIFSSDLLPDQAWKHFLLHSHRKAFETRMLRSDVRDIFGDDSVQFDVVLAEVTFAPVYAFSYKFNCPIIGLSSSPEMLLSFVVHPIMIRESFFGSAANLNFWQRLWSTYAQIRLTLCYDYEIMPELDRIARKYFGDDMPYLGDIEKNVSIILTTHNFITSKPKPTVPALIEIGNVHLKKNVKLPQDLQKELDKATNGVIYFSLGSNVKSANISSQLRNVIISSFAELPYTILWKWETDHLPGKPDNVITRKWLPQEAVLAHPNVKAFITQGGLQSMEEAIYYRKPLIGMPFFADQMKNVRSIAEHGIGVALNTDTLTKEKLKSAILEVVNDKKYKEKISELSDLMWDQPMSGLDTAIWWIEYVIRHKGAKHLRSPLLDLPLYQYLLLDVLAFVFGVIATTLGLLYAAYIYTKPVIQGVVGKNKVKSN